MAHDWGHVFTQAAGGLLGSIFGGSAVPDYTGFGGPANIPSGDIGPPVAASPVTGGLGVESCEGMIWTGGVPPKGYKVVNFCNQGVLRKIRRRRRRRLLTASDKADIAAIVGLVGKGQMASSLISRVST